MLNPEIRAAAREFLAAGLADDHGRQVAAATRLADGMDLGVLQQAMFMETLTAITSPARVLLLALLPPQQRDRLPELLDRAAIMVAEADRMRDLTGRDG